VTLRLLEKIDQVGALASGHCEGCRFLQEQHLFA